MELSAYVRVTSFLNFHTFGKYTDELTRTIFWWINSGLYFQWDTNGNRSKAITFATKLNAVRKLKEHFADAT